MADKITASDLLPEVSGFDNVSGPIVDAWFEVSAEYELKAGAPVPMLVCSVDDENFEEPVKIGGFGCGGLKKDKETHATTQDKWDISEDSRSLIPKKGAPKFNAKSNAGIFVASICLVAGEGDLEKGAGLLAGRGFLMTDAQFYIGLDSHWVRQQFKNPVDETATPIKIQVATEYVRFGKVEKTSAPAAKKAEKATDKSAKATGVTAEDIAKLKKLINGKKEQEAKQAIVKEFKGTPVLNEVFTKGLLTELEKKGELVKDGDTYIITA